MSGDRANPELEARNAFDAERAQRLQARTITAGDLWRHYKGGVYRIVAANARMEISGEPCVVYAAVNRPDDSVWVLLRVAFLNEIAPGVPRFRQLDPILLELLNEKEPLP
jgi:hypothetical protein